ncbi:MAG: T9SS type A sorting domain-containing protein [Ignavibacteriae bacterium]|nr:T9SS type A sorting domain-containing protein [Ignavibacteriota bacterium]
MKPRILVIALLYWLCSQMLYAQASRVDQTTSSEIEEESAETEELNADGVNTPILYTMTGGAFETSGRVLLYSTESSAAASILNQDQAEKSGLIETPLTYRLDQNYPNPFNPTTTIQFELPDPALVTLKIYNMLGQEVRTLLDHESMEDGQQDVKFDASPIASGVYFYRIVAEGIPDEDGTQAQRFTEVKKMMLIK